MPTPGVALADLTWVEAEPVLAAGPLVVLPLGAGSKEHGPHLRLDNDRRTVEFLAERLRERLPVVVAPTITYHHYPAFVEYPGSVTLRLETARDLVVDICRSLAAFGPREIVLTHKDGLLVLAGGEVHEAPFLPRPLRGRSGRGDTCVGSYTSRRLSASPAEATRWAAAVTTLKLEAEGPVRGTPEDVAALLAERYA